jgi:N-methylhydantoinase A/oxoprolinase/acetone carboxylase beta subunit
MFEDGSSRDCDVHRRDALATDTRIAGPAVIDDPATNIIIGPADSAVVLDGGHILIEVGAAA